MHQWDLLILSAKNVLRAGPRTVLCALAICIGITSVSMILGIGTAAETAVGTEMDRIGISGVALYHKEGESVPEEALQVVAQTKGITASMQFAIATGSIRLRNTRSNAGILGIDSALADVFHLEVLYGALPTKQQVRSGEKVAVIDADLARKVYKRENIVGKKLTVTIDGISEKLKICGIIRSQSAGLSTLFGGQLPYLVYLPYTVLKEIDPSVKTDKILLTGDMANLEALATSALEKLNRKFGNAYKYENLSQYVDSLGTITDTVTLLISGIAAISVLVGGIGVMNAMISSVDTRTREVGIYRALGAKKRMIVQTFLSEAILLCLIGGACGLILSGTAFYLLRIQFQWKTAISSFVMAMGCGVIFGLLPALRAARLDPIQAIRTE